MKISTTVPREYYFIINELIQSETSDRLSSDGDRFCKYDLAKIQFSGGKFSDRPRKSLFRSGPQSSKSNTAVMTIINLRSLYN